MNVYLDSPQPSSTGHPLEQSNTQSTSTGTSTGCTSKLFPLKIVKYAQDKVLNEDNGNFVKKNAWKPLFRKMKTLH